MHFVLYDTNALSQESNIIYNFLFIYFFLQTPFQRRAVKPSLFFFFFNFDHFSDLIGESTCVTGKQSVMLNECKPMF